MELVEHTFEELSKLKYRIYTTTLSNECQNNVLVVAFEGEYGFGCKGNADARLIAAIIAGVRAAWESSYFVLDYRSMTYEWGDMLPLATGQEKMSDEVFQMLRVFGSAPGCSATLISDRNRDSINSLIASDCGYGTDASWLFDDLDAAIVAFEDARKRFLQEVSGTE
jgi:hypothetical protein